MSAQKPQDQYVKVGNINTRFWAAGDKGTYVILLHPGLGTVEMWQHNLNALAQHHRVYAIDTIGFGRTDKPEVPYSMAYSAQHVNEFMEVQGIEVASLVGNCLGGAISLQFAINFPEKLEKLVLVDSFGLGREMAFIMRMSTVPVIGELLMRPSRRLPSMLGKKSTYDPAVITDELVEDLYQCISLPGAQKAYMSVFCAVQNFRGPRPEILRFIGDNLGNIAAPTLIIWGKQDRILPVAHAYVAREKIPNSELHIFDPCGHIPEFECPEEFNALVLEFLAK
jgi:pimeloyl-ACP methyl ester carboxylesterase